jgi:beta-lactamase class A
MNEAFLPRGRLAVALLLLCLLGAWRPVAAQSDLDWPERLLARLDQVDAAHVGELGVYVKDLDSGLSATYHADQPWYFASGIKVPVAIAVLRAVERGDFGLDSTLRLEPGDYVDGAGPTKRLPSGSEVRVDFLLEQMLIHSDNTASDMLIRLVGLENVNLLIRELVPQGLQRISSLADVRRHAYSHYHPTAFQLSGKDFLLLRQQKNETQRRAMLAHLLGLAPEQLLLHADLDSAFEAFYNTRLNSGLLSAYGQLLESILDGRALSPEQRDYLLALLRRVVTGEKRIKAGLPGHVRFAHKTGTQRNRTCDLGIAEAPGRRLIVAVCTRGASLAQAERVMREVGKAVALSGVLSAATGP